MVLIKDITAYLESLVPLSLQESYDNCGLIVGDSSAEVSGVLVTLDCLEETIDEAIDKKCNLVVAHHPVIFSGIKKLNGNNDVERTIIKAIRNQIAIYAIHTNLDNSFEGVNRKIGEKLGLVNLRILEPVRNELRKLVTFCPAVHADKVRVALFAAGAGKIGNYDQTSFNASGTGSFRALEGANPFVGEMGKLHLENEVRIETVFPRHIEESLIRALKGAHPYEEVAFDIYSINNPDASTGSGMIGELKDEMEEKRFLEYLKSAMNISMIRHTQLLNKTVKKVAVCGGSGSFLLKRAIAEKADIFISSDFKYHQFFDADGRIVIADVGHYESEQFTIELIKELIVRNFSTFAVRLTELVTNPVHYY